MLTPCARHAHAVHTPRTHTPYSRHIHVHNMRPNTTHAHGQTCHLFALGCQTLAWIGWSIFLLLVITSYTANLAAFLIIQPTPTYILSMSAATTAGTRVCVPGALYETIYRLHPDANLLPDFGGSLASGCSSCAATFYVEQECGALVWALQVAHTRIDSTTRMPHTIRTLGV